MTRFEYKVVPAPRRAEKTRGAKQVEDRFAHALMTLMNKMGRDGWEYLRADTLPCEERSGLTGRSTTFQNMLVFRRALPDEAAAGDEAAFAAPRPVAEPRPATEPLALAAEARVNVQPARPPRGDGPRLVAAAEEAASAAPALGPAARDEGRDGGRDGGRNGGGNGRAD